MSTSGEIHVVFGSGPVGLAVVEDAAGAGKAGPRRVAQRSAAFAA